MAIFWRFVASCLRPLRLDEEKKEERNKEETGQTRMWDSAQRDGRPAEYR